jgi:hypothetical protein
MPYRVAGCIVDVMPTDGSVLGFPTRWFIEAIEGAELKSVGEETAWIVAPEYFLATKLEAFKDRGSGDYLASHDIQDFVAVVDGCSAIAERILKCPSEFQRYMGKECKKLISRVRFP